MAKKPISKKKIFGYVIGAFFVCGIVDGMINGTNDSTTESHSQVVQPDTSTKWVSTSRKDASGNTVQEFTLTSNDIPVDLVISKYSNGRALVSFNASPDAGGSIDFSAMRTLMVTYEDGTVKYYHIDLDMYDQFEPMVRKDDVQDFINDMRQHKSMTIDMPTQVSDNDTHTFTIQNMPVI